MKKPKAKQMSKQEFRDMCNFGKRIDRFCVYEKKQCKCAENNMTDGVFNCLARVFNEPLPCVNKR